MSNTTAPPASLTCPYWCEVTARHATEVLHGEVWHERQIGEHVFIDQHALTEGEPIVRHPRISIPELPSEELTANEARRLATDLVEAAAQLEGIEEGGL